MAWHRTLATMTIGAACVAPSVAINMEQQLVLGGSLALLAGATLSVLVAAACPIVMHTAWTKRHGGMAATALIFFIVCLGWNLTNAIGAASVARDSFAGGREASSARVAILRNQLSQAQTTRTQLSQTAAGRTPAMIEGEIAGLKHDRRWTSTRECQDATAGASRDFCAGIERLRSQLGAAQRIEDL